MLSAKQWSYWYHFYIVFVAVLDWGMNPGRPTLEARTLPLGYEGSLILQMENQLSSIMLVLL